MSRVRSTLHESAADDIADWFRQIGVTIPDPEPFALYPEEPDESDQCWITPDKADIEDLANSAVWTVRNADQTFPGPRSWRRWKLTRRLSSFLYVSGITGSGGATGWGGGDPVGTPIYDLPSLKSLRYRRPYILWKRRYWWECHRRQGWRIWEHHRPLEPFGFDICAACMPCQTCGQPYACELRCPEAVSR